MAIVKPTAEYYAMVTYTPYTVTVVYDDYIIDISSNTVINLPAASNSGLRGKIFKFRRIDNTANTVTIQAYGTDLIDGVSNISLDSLRVLKLIRNDTSNGWTRLMENERLLSFQNYSASGSLNPAIDVHQLNNTAALAMTLPASNSVPGGTRYVCYTTGITYGVTIGPASTSGDTINSSATPLTISAVANSGKTFVNTNYTQTNGGNWVQF